MENMELGSRNHWQHTLAAFPKSRFLSNSSVLCGYKWSDALLLYTCSAGIESEAGSVDGMSDAICNACEMIVFWMQSELNSNKTKEGTLEYVDRVRVDLSSH